jgi:tetratricopeptide (TPR) repeat protein
LKRAVIALVGLILIFSVNAQGVKLPFSRTISLQDFDDNYSQAFTLPVYVEKDGAYKPEDRVIRIAISPQERLLWEDEEGLWEEKDFFFKVLVSISLSDMKGTISKDFRGYINCELVDCEDWYNGRLFWDQAGQERADWAGKLFNQSNPLILRDQYFEVTLNLVNFKKSDWSCDPADDWEQYYNAPYYCISDKCIILLDSLTLQLAIDYSSNQRNVITQHEKASQHVMEADEYFKEGEFAKARTEYEQAESIYSQIGEDSSSIQEKIELCDSHLVAYESLQEGMRIFEEATGIEEYQEAIEKFEEARSLFEKAKNEFDEVGDTSSVECQSWIDKCNDEISNLEGVGRLRTRLIYIIIAIVLLASAGFIIKQIKRENPHEAVMKESITIRVKHAEAEQEVSLQVSKSEKIGRIRQMAGTKLGIVPSDLWYKGKSCPPDKTVDQCGIENEAVLEIKSKEEKSESGEKERVEKQTDGIRCPKCGEENPSGSGFCSNCGARLALGDA